MQAPKQFDAIIVGTGIAGLSVAIALARRKKKVLMFGKNLPGEASPAAAGILDPFLEMSPGHPLFKLSCAAFRRYPASIKRLAKFVKKDLGYARQGMIYAAFSRQEESELKKRFSWQKKSGIPVVRWTRSQIFRSETCISPQVRSGLFYPTIGRIRPQNLLKALFHYARELGVRILKTKEDAHLLVFGNRAEGVRLGSRVYRAESVINAAGAWAGKSPLGIKPPIAPARGQILIVKGKEIARKILHSLGGFYIVPWERNTFLLGSTVEFAGFKTGTTQQGIQRIKEGTGKLVPAIRDFQIIKTWAGLRPFSKDRLPLIGPASMEGLYWALGFYRSGILIGSYAGELLAEGMISGKWPKILRPFDPRRLG